MQIKYQPNTEPVLTCPFSIIDQFDRWWQWHYRVFHRKQDRLYVSADIMGVVDKMKREMMAKIEREIMQDTGSFLSR